MARMAKGLMATIEVSGTQDASLMHEGPAANATSNAISGITQADAATATELGNMDTGSNGTSPADGEAKRHAMDDMPMNHVAMEHGSGAASAKSQKESAQQPGSRSALPIASKSGATLNGCLTLMNDGKVMLKLLHSEQTYRLEGQPFAFDENDNRLVHVGGYFGSVVASEDPHIPSFVVETLTRLAPNCSAQISPAVLRKLTAGPQTHQPGAPITVGMSEMKFLQPVIKVNVGETVTWKNTSSTIHNVVANPAKAMIAADVHLPQGAPTFDSGFLQPGQSFTHKFTIPGVYRYVCTLHEGGGMKGVVVVKAPGATKMASTLSPNPEEYPSR